MLAVEHIEPKHLPANAHLVGEWKNYLLGCVNCNSTKGAKPVDLDMILLPDRDNTIIAYDYAADGSVSVRSGLAAGIAAKAANTLELVGLDKPISVVEDDNGKLVVVDRASKRMEVMGIAREALLDLTADPGNNVLVKWIVRSAVAEGLFSIWYETFRNNPEVLKPLIDAHAGTRESECFHPATQLPVSPAPNPDLLTPGGRL